MLEEEFKIYISKKLEHLDEIVKFTKGNQSQFIEPHSDISITEYAVLILDKKSEGLYSDIIYRSEGQFDTIAFFDDARNNSEDIINAINVLRELIQRPGVLNESQIVALTNLDILIYDPRTKNIKSASYDLSLSSEHFVSGIKLTKSNKVEIEPLDFVIVRAKESANIPSNICANFDLRVNMFCKGIILSNGPQVDPGYMGRFLCLLFNSSSKQYTKDEDERFCSVVFQSLSSTSKKYSGSYQRKESIGDYVKPYAQETISTNIQRIHGIIKAQDKQSQDLESQKGSIKTLTTKEENLENRVSKIEGNYPLAVSIIGFGLGLCGFVISIFIAMAFNGIQSDVGSHKSQISLLEKERIALERRIQDLEESNSLSHIAKKEIRENLSRTPEECSKSVHSIKKDIAKEKTKSKIVIPAVAPNI